MTCALARKPSPVILRGEAIGIIRQDNVDWETFRRLHAPETRWSFTVPQLACIFCVGVCVGFMMLAVLIAFLGGKT